MSVIVHDISETYSRRPKLIIDSYNIHNKKTEHDNRGQTLYFAASV